MFRQAFEPARNKEGYAKLTFLGCTTKTGESPEKDSDGNVLKNEDGSIKLRKWVLNLLEFDCLGVVRGFNQKISITCGEVYAPDNLLGITLSAMGFQSNSMELEEDDDGFTVQSFNDESTDDDGFTQVEGDTLADIIGFLESCKGCVYIAFVNKCLEGKRKGFWEIDANSLKPFVKPKKEEKQKKGKGNSKTAKETTAKEETPILEPEIVENN